MARPRPSATSSSRTSRSSATRSGIRRSRRPAQGARPRAGRAPSPAEGGGNWRASIARPAAAGRESRSCAQ
ncbi:MAG: hypothetical protein F9K16_01415 [Thermoanaerobaculia bacterium]|nr:MAG: hypothetical protein F9K16_01415 [Thermoanaerobaculia bacterium]